MVVSWGLSGITCGYGYMDDIWINSIIRNWQVGPYRANSPRPIPIIPVPSLREVCWDWHETTWKPPSRNQARNNSILLVSSPFHAVLGRIAIRVSSKVMSSLQYPRLALNNIILGGQWAQHAGASFGLPTRHLASKQHGQIEQIGQNYIWRFWRVIEPLWYVFHVEVPFFPASLGSKPPSPLAQSQWSPDPSEQARSPWVRTAEAFAWPMNRAAALGRTEPSTPDTKWAMCSMYATCDERCFFLAAASCGILYPTFLPRIRLWVDVDVGH